MIPVAYLASDARAHEGTFIAHLLQARPILLAHLRGRMSRASRARLDLEDVWQEVCVIALRFRERFHWQSRARFLRWLELVATRRLHRALRQMDRVPSPPGDGEAEVDSVMHPQAGPALQAQRSEEVARVVAAMRELTELQRRVLQLCLQHGLSHIEAAQRLGRHSETVRKCRYRALLALRKALDTDPAFRRTSR